jgi:hypothetical protein
MEHGSGIVNTALLAFRSPDTAARMERNLTQQ